MTPKRAFLISLLFLLFACKEKEDILTPPDYSGYLEPKIFKVQTDDVTKSALDGLSIHFEEGDEIAIWDGAALRKFVAQTSEQGLVFMGEAVEADTYWALYPWSEDCLVTPVEKTPIFKSSVPAVQNAREGGFTSGANVAVGTGGSDHVIQMRNVCGFLKFDLPSATLPALAPGSMNVVKLTSASGEMITGSFQVTFDSKGLPVVTPDAKSEGNESVAISFDKESAKAGGSYYYTLLPSDLSSGITMEFTRSADSAVAVKSSGKNSNVLKRNTVLDLKTVLPDWTPVDGEEADDKTPDPSGTFDYHALGQTSHPRLLLCDSDFKRLNSLLADKSYPELTNRHNRVINYADGLLGTSIPTLSHIESSYPSFNVQKNRHLEELARPAFGRLFACSYAYRTTGDKKYLDDCRTLLAQLCNDEDWYPQSFLSTAEIALGVSIAYDWLYYDLTKYERETIRQNLCSKAIREKTETTLNKISNVGQVHNAGLIAAAIVCYEKARDLCHALIEESISQMPSIVSGIYTPKGSYFEGYSYWNYGTNFQCLYNESLLTAFGTDKGLYDDPGFHSSADYRLFMADNIASFSYADGGRSKVMPSPAMWFYAAHFQQPHLLFNELRLGKNDTDSRTTPMIPCALAKYSKLNTDATSSPMESVWVDGNEAAAPVVIVRKGWTGKESDVYLGIKGGKANLNHGHMDAGSFVYHANGKIWSADVTQKAYSEYTDAGLSGKSQKDGTWKALVYSSLGHSTMSFSNYAESLLESLFSEDKIHPTDHMVDGKATILESWTTGDELGAKLDLTPLYKYQANSVTRKAVVLKDGSLKIEDSITASSSSDSKLIWRIVTPAKVSVSDGSIMLVQGNDFMKLTTSCTEGSVSDLTLCDWGTFQQSRPSGGQWGWNETPTWNENHSGYEVAGFTLTVPKGKTAVMTTLLMKDEASSALVASGSTVGLENMTSGGDFKW